MKQEDVHLSLSLFHCPVSKVFAVCSYGVIPASFTQQPREKSTVVFYIALSQTLSVCGPYPSPLPAFLLLILLHLNLSAPSIFPLYFHVIMM